MLHYDVALQAHPLPYTLLPPRSRGQRRRFPSCTRICAFARTPPALLALPQLPARATNGPSHPALRLLHSRSPSQSPPRPTTSPPTDRAPPPPPPPQCLPPPGPLTPPPASHIPAPCGPRSGRVPNRWRPGRGAQITNRCSGPEHLHRPHTCCASVPGQCHQTPCPLNGPPPRAPGYHCLPALSRARLIRRLGGPALPCPATLCVRQPHTGPPPRGAWAALPRPAAALRSASLLTGPPPRASWWTSSRLRGPPPAAPAKWPGGGGVMGVGSGGGGSMVH